MIFHKCENDGKLSLFTWHRIQNESRLMMLKESAVRVYDKTSQDISYRRETRILLSSCSRASISTT